MINYLIYDDDCGICTFFKDKLLIFQLDYSFLGSSYFEDYLPADSIDKNLLEKTIVVVKDYNGEKLIYTQSAAIFEILADILHLHKEEREFLFSPAVIKLFNPLYRLFARNRRKISLFFNLNACKIK